MRVEGGRDDRVLSGPGQDVFTSALRACATHRVAAQIFSVQIALLYLAPSIYMMQVYDRVLSTGGVMTLVFMSAILALALLCHSVLDGARQRVLARSALRLDRVLGPQLIRLGLTGSGHVDARNAQILREFDVYRASLQGPVAIAMLDLPFSPVFIIVCFALHPWLGGLVLSGSSLLVFVAFLGDRATRLAAETTEGLAPATYATAEMNQANGGVVKALGMRGVMTRRITDARRTLNDEGTRNAFIATRYSGLIRLLRMALQSASLGLGAYLAIRLEISPGSMIAASILSGRALAPIEQIVGAWRQLGQARVARRALIAFLENAPSDGGHTRLPTPVGRLSVEGVSVRAGGADKWALQTLVFKLGPGEAMGVIGPSGAGKSTLARILVGAQLPDAGTIRLDGSSLADWDSDVLGAHIGYVPQETALFAGSIADNISRFSDASGAGGKIVEAAEAAGIHELVQRQCKGYDTVLGPRGEGLSAGQAQRVALARALYNDPCLLVLDEPNAHLDSDGDASLLETLSAARARGASVVIMTHRSGILAAVDKLMVLRDGRIVQFGRREDVLAELRKSAVQGGQIRAMSASG